MLGAVARTDGRRFKQLAGIAQGSFGAEAGADDEDYVGGVFFWGASEVDCAGLGVTFFMAKLL